MSNYVLDSSAILALLNNEPGAERVEQVLSASSVSSVNIAEVLIKSIEAGHTLASATKTLDVLKLNVIAFSYLHAAKSAELRPLTRPLGLSLGDRACLALAILSGASTVTADRNWKGLNICPIEMIR